MVENLKISVSDGVCSLQIDRPEKKNALNLALYQSLNDALATADADPKVRVLLLRGTDDCFTSGNDVADFLSIIEGDQAKAAIVGNFLKVLRGLKKPVIAAVQGTAIGIGTTLLLHCDLAYGGQSSRYHLPFVDLGLCPEFASSYILTRSLGHRRASELLLLAAPFDADKAKDYGILNEVVNDADLYTYSLKIAQQLAAKSPSALRVSKSLMRQYDAEQITKAIDSEIVEFFALLKKPEAKEALTAFMQKRKPDFSQPQ